jgi:hypothetical protein
MSDQILFDSQTSFQGGMQNGFDPALVSESQYYRGINVSCRDGMINSRPSFNKKNIDFSLMNFSKETIAKAEEAYEKAKSNFNQNQEAIETNEEIRDGLVEDLESKDAAIVTAESEEVTAKITYEGMVEDNDLIDPDPWSPEEVAEAKEIWENKKNITLQLKEERAVLVNDLKDVNKLLVTLDAQVEFLIKEIVRTKEMLDKQFDQEWVFKNGKFQGSKEYKTNNETCSIVVISGHIYSLNLETFILSCLTTKKTAINELVDRCYIVQAGPFVIVQDGISTPRIIQGSSLRLSDQSKEEVPVGKLMAYGHGRLAIQTSDRHLILGDPFIAYRPSNVLRFKETKILNEGGGFTVSDKLGKIISLQYSNVSDTSTGDGPLLAICENGFSTFAVNNPRRNWMNIPMQKVQLLGSGIVGMDASTNVNEDILYRSHEGIRSYAVGRTESSSAYKYTELSREVEPYIQADKGHSSKFISMAFFDKRMLSTTGPKGIKVKMRNWQEAKERYEENPTEENARALRLQVTDDVCFKGIISFDFSMAGFTKSTSESQYQRLTTGSYDGIWTGVRPTKIFSSIVGAEKRCFMFAKNSFGENTFHEITRKYNGRDNRSIPIDSSLELRAMPMKMPSTYVPTPFIYKHLEDITLWVDDIEGEVNVDISLSSDVIANFQKIGEMKFLAKVRGERPVNGSPQSRAMTRMLRAKEFYDNITNDPILQGNEFQIRLEWSGKMRIRRVLAAGRQIADPITKNIETEMVAYPIDTFDEYAYQSE